MENESILEKISESLPVVGATTALASFLGGPVAALIPVLTSTLATGRHKKRVEDAINEIDDRLRKIENIEKSLTDAQYKLINEMVLSIFNTPDDEKIEYIKKALYNTPYNDSLTLHEATIQSRVINQISISELTFLMECHGNAILFGDHKYDGFINIEKDSFDGECILGLMSLGLISRSSAEGLMSDIGAYHFTPLATKIYDLLSN